MGTKDNIWYKIIHYGLEFIGRHYSSYRAIVVDNEDPLGLGRLKVIVPSLNPSAVLDDWAFPIGCWGGNNYGIQMLPRKGDMVFIEFTNGDPDYPNWKFGSYAENEKPEEFETVKHYGFKTPNGSLVIINDNKDQEEILVKLNNNAEWLKINKEVLEVEAKLIKLGKNGDEKAVMGETLKNKMDEIMDKLDNTYQMLINHTHTGPNGPTGPPIQANTLVQIKQEMTQIKNSFPDYLSDKVKIDK